jgi:ubiquinone/menaquinone biosynthesis C-methylase UbiE
LAAASRPDFDELAEHYDRLRPVDENWWELFERLVDEGDLLGRRVLDVGCGTGAFAAALARRGARVWGVDPSREMLARVRKNAGATVGLKQGRAEALPFKDGWFERVVFRLVLHLVDRPVALGEAARVLDRCGRVAIATFAPQHFESYWLNRFFPDILAIDVERFPTTVRLDDELRAAGFGPARAKTFQQKGRLARKDALERIRGRFISTLRLLDEEAYATGLARAERELPEVVEFTTDWVLVLADRR